MSASTSSAEPRIQKQLYRSKVHKLTNISRATVCSHPIRHTATLPVGGLHIVASSTSHERWGRLAAFQLERSGISAACRRPETLRRWAKRSGERSRPLLQNCCFGLSGDYNLNSSYEFHKYEACWPHKADSGTTRLHLARIRGMLHRSPATGCLDALAPDFRSDILMPVLYKERERFS